MHIKYLAPYLAQAKWWVKYYWPLVCCPNFSWTWLGLWLEHLSIISELVLVLVFYCCHNKFSSLNNIHVLSHSSAGQKFSILNFVSPKAIFRMLAGLHAFLKSSGWIRIQSHFFFFFLNSVPCDCRTEVPILLLVADWGSCSAPRTYGSLHLQSQQPRLCP